MNEQHVVTFLSAKQYPTIKPILRDSMMKYPDIQYQSFEEFDDYKGSEHWGKTDILLVHFRNSAEIEEAILNNPVV